MTVDICLHRSKQLFHADIRRTCAAQGFLQTFFCIGASVRAHGPGYSLRAEKQQVARVQPQPLFRIFRLFEDAYNVFLSLIPERLPFGISCRCAPKEGRSVASIHADELPRRQVQHSEENGNFKLTLDEIIEEIRQARLGRKSTTL
jgi:hypothetical protein